MINFTRAFDLAWERMMVILFRPFDLGKWFAIGFSAFLAGLLSGGNGFNGSFNRDTFQKNNWSASYSSNLNHFNAGISNALSAFQAGLTFSIIVAIFALGLALVLLFYWLGARGQFLFLDNIVRNRGAIAWPWHTYARLGNSLWGFYLLFLLIGMVAMVPLIVAGVFVFFPYFRAHQWPEDGQFTLAIILGLIFLAVMIIFSVALFLFRELGVPLMFRRGLFAWPAFREIGRLTRLYPGPIFLFVLLRFALFLALIIVSIIVCCFSCCLTALPYLGTVFLLPALVYIKCFTLEFLAQFGPEYDVWTVDVSPATAISPPPPPG